MNKPLNQIEKFCYLFLIGMSLMFLPSIIWGKADWLDLMAR